MAAINVEKLSLKELIALEAKLAAAIATARQKERAEIKSKVAELAERHGFSISELFGGPGRSNSRSRPGMPWRVMRIAPNPIRFTGMSPPRVMLPAAAAGTSPVMGPAA